MQNKASASIFVIVFGAVLSLLIAGILNLSIMQMRVLQSKYEKNNALYIAEAGLSWYKWLVSEHPDRASSDVSKTKDFKDTNGKLIGKFSVVATPYLSCGKTQYVDVKSDAEFFSKNNKKASVSARLIKPSVAEYSYIINADVWAGASRKIVGPYHSNGGIRMDGENNSTVTSAKSTWYCDWSFGCSPPRYVSGVFGSGPNSSLWIYPTDSIDFSMANLDFAELKSMAQSGGIFLPSFAGTDTKGYELIFKDDGTVDVYKVLYSSYTWGYRREYGYKYSWSFGWRRERNRITSKTFYGNFTIPANCSLIFSEEKLWVKGVVDGKVSVFAYKNNSYKPEIVLEGNLEYKDSDGSDGILLFSQSYILIPEYSPQNMRLDGIFVAQEGSFGRSYYSNNFRDTLTINGTIVSNDRVGTSWGCPYFCSGYAHRINSYDRFLRDAPPPFTPRLSDKFKYIQWRENKI